MPRHMTSAMTLGERIRKARGKLTQEEFADLIGVLANTVSRWERDLCEPQGAAKKWLRANHPDIYEPGEDSGRPSATGTEG